MIAIFANKGSKKELTDALSRIQTPLEDYVIVCGRQTPLPKNIRIGLCDGSNKSALHFFEKLQVPVITCSMNPLDSITLSSQENDSCFIAVQRSFERQNGSVLEAADYPVKLTCAFVPFTVLTVAAVMLLNGNVPQTI